jgi:hypothetical protein
VARGPLPAEHSEQQEVAERFGESWLRHPHAGRDTRSPDPGLGGLTHSGPTTYRRGEPGGLTPLVSGLAHAGVQAQMERQSARPRHRSVFRSDTRCNRFPRPGVAGSIPAEGTTLCRASGDAGQTVHGEYRAGGIAGADVREVLIAFEPTRCRCSTLLGWLRQSVHACSCLHRERLRANLRYGVGVEVP